MWRQESQVSMRVMRGPPQDPSPLRGTLGSSLRSPAEGEGNERFPPPPDQAPPGSQASSRGEAKDSALLSSRDAGLLEPPERSLQEARLPCLL